MTTQVCAEVEVRLLPEIEQPAVEVAKVTAPELEPPDVVSESVEPKAADVEVRVRAF